jgi:calcineurin-like phosphoesterase family protein
MSKVWFCSDLHLGHKNIARFRKEVYDCQENTEKILQNINDTVSKNDDLWVLGDWCFDEVLVPRFMEIKCRSKYLVRGNHDEFDMRIYNSVFDVVYGLVDYKEFWLSHAPIHPQELRGGVNLHGHVHYDNVKTIFNPVYDVKQGEDNRYFNCCPENLWPKYGRCLVSLDEIRRHYE